RRDQEADREAAPGVAGGEDGGVPLGTHRSLRPDPLTERAVPFPRRALREDDLGNLTGRLRDAQDFGPKQRAPRGQARVRLDALDVAEARRALRAGEALPRETIRRQRERAGEEGRALDDAAGRADAHDGPERAIEAPAARGGGEEEPALDE